MSDAYGVDDFAPVSSDGPGQDAPDVWDPSVPPGGVVCGACGMPVESEPCAEHQARAYAAMSDPD